MLVRGREKLKRVACIASLSYFEFSKGGKRSETMGFFKHFLVDKNRLGPIRTKFMERIDKDFRLYLNYKSLDYPEIEEWERRRGFSRILGQTQSEAMTSRTLKFHAEIKGQSFRNLIGGISPVYVGKILREEYTYTTLFPYPCDSPIVFLERKGLLLWERGFFAVPSLTGLEYSEEITESDLLYHDSDGPSPFEWAEHLRLLRTFSAIQSAVRLKQQSFVSNYLNEMWKKGKLPQVTGLKAKSEVAVHLFGPKVRPKSYGVTVILLPIGDNTFAQVGDLSLWPSLAIDVLNSLADGISDAGLAQPFQQYPQTISKPLPRPEEEKPPEKCLQCRARLPPDSKKCIACGAPKGEEPIPAEIVPPPPVCSRCGQEKPKLYEGTLCRLCFLITHKNTPTEAQQIFPDD